MITILIIQAATSLRYAAFVKIKLHQKNGCYDAINTLVTLLSVKA